jgi:hypothetical protein
MRAEPIPIDAQTAIARFTDSLIDRRFLVPDTAPGFRAGVETTFYLTRNRRIIEHSRKLEPQNEDFENVGNWREVTRAEFRAAMGWTADGFPPALSWLEEPADEYREWRNQHRRQSGPGMPDL